MKHKGANFEYEQQRNRELLAAYRKQLHEARFIRRVDVLRKTALQPTSRFWVSEHRAAIVIARMCKGDTLSDMRPLKREMFQEIYRRYLSLKQHDSAQSLYALVSVVVNQPAPKFYLTPESVKTIISRIKKRRKQQL